MTESLLEQIIVGAVVLVSAVYLTVRAYRSIFRKEPDCGTCAGCPSRSQCIDGTTGKIDAAKKRDCTHGASS